MNSSYQKNDLTDDQKEIARLKERERSLMRQLDLARATIAFQAHGILAPKDIENAKG